MTAEPPRVKEAIDGLVELALGLGAFVGEETLSVAGAIDDETFDADVAAASAAKFAVLPLLAAGAFVRELADAAAVLTAPIDVLSDPLPGIFEDKVVGKVRFLAMAGPLQPGFPDEPVIPVNRITLDPSTLGPNDTTFEVQIASIAGESGYFSGDVEVSATVGGQSLRTVPVWVVIP